MDQNSATVTAVEPRPEPASPISRGRAVWTFTRHYAEMVVAMYVGMYLLAPLWTWAFLALGWTPLSQRPALHAVVMATDMAVAMSAWMTFRGHRWVPVAEMAAAMYVPFLVLLPPLWAGALDGGGVMFWGHVLMFPAMFGVMLWRRGEYTQDHAHHRHP